MVFTEMREKDTIYLTLIVVKHRLIITNIALSEMTANHISKAY